MSIEGLVVAFLIVMVHPGFVTQLAALTAAMEGGAGTKGHDGFFCVFRPHSWHITWYSYSTREGP